MRSLRLIAVLALALAASLTLAPAAAAGGHRSNVTVRQNTVVRHNSGQPLLGGLRDRLGNLLHRNQNQAVVAVPAQAQYLHAPLVNNQLLFRRHQVSSLSQLNSFSGAYSSGANIQFAPAGVSYLQAAPIVAPAVTYQAPIVAPAVTYQAQVQAPLVQQQTVTTSTCTTSCTAPAAAAAAGNTNYLIAPQAVVLPQRRVFLQNCR